MKIKYTASLLMLIAAPLCAQTPRDFAIDLYATVSTNVPCVTLNWTIRRQGNITGQEVYRRLKGETAWTNRLAVLATNQTSYADVTAATGIEYEYWMKRTYTGISPTTAQGYLSAGVNVPMADSRGVLLLVIDSTMVATLAPEIEQLKADLTGDGWRVQAITALRSDTAANVRAQIKAAYDADPANVKAVYVLGHVPVPYSGSIAPDGHSNHVGAWPADGYYGDMNGTWTDTSVNNTSASDARNRNIPGDGKFDQSSLPSPVELMVGRVDLANMTRAPAATVSEISLLRRYLRKAHDFKFKQGAYAAIPRRGMVRNGFGYFSGENFAIAGWSWIFTGVTPTQIDEPPSDQWFSASYAGGKSYLVGYGDGGGSWDSSGGVGNSVDFGLKTSRVVFTSLFGSYFGDWDSGNNFMRAPLAGNATGDSLGLTCFWGGRPNRVTHHMGMGETAGYCMMVSHNSSMTGGGGYTPNIYNGVHCGLMGDPALRLHAVEPPRNLSASSANTQVTLDWTPSTETNLLGYLVYRAATAAGPFTRLTALPQAATSYSDATVTAGQSYTYLVRTLKLETSPGGTYENPSVGSLVTLTANAGAAAPDNPTSLTVVQTSSTNAWLSWTDNASNETGFRIERKTNAGGSFAPLVTVAASVTNFTDSGPFTHGNVYIYRVIATGGQGDSAPSPEDSFEAFAGFFNLPVTRMKVSKTAGTATVTVNRFGGVTGAVSVNFATSDTSAFAGTHYMATNGTLTWADGDTAPKTVTVPLINTAAPQSARQFKITLSSPSAGTALTINSYTAVLIQDPTASLGAPWSQTIVGGITDSSAAVTEAGSLCSVTIGGAGLTASANSESGQFIYRSFTGDGVLTAFFPAGLPGDGNARYALMARASTANNTNMAAVATSSNTGVGTKLYSRSSSGAYSTESPSTANTLVLPRWLRLIRAGNVFSAETSADGYEWVSVASATIASMPATVLWGIFHTSSDWSVTGLGNFHLLQAQNVTLTALPPPSAPTGLTATLASSTSATLRWNNASFSSGYRIERRTETGDFAPIASVAAGSGTNQTYSNTGLAVNTAYAYRVVATNAVGESAPSSPAYVATASDMLMQLTTGAPGGADATVWGDLGDTPTGTLTNLSAAAYDPYTDTYLTNTAKTYLRFNLAGVGAISSATLKLSLLGVREYAAFYSTYLNAYALADSSDGWAENTITWSNAPQNDVSGSGFLSPTTWLGYVYNFADDTTAPGTIINLTLNASSLSSSRGADQLVTIGLVNDWSAYIDLAAQEHPDYAPPTLELIVTTNTPNRAAFLTAAPGTGWSIDLGWQDTSASETGFRLERREGGGDFAELQTFGPNATAFHDGTTQPGVTYTYRVRSFNASGPSDWTPEVTITAATLDTAMSTVWDGGGADTLFTTVTNWDFNTRPAFDGAATITFGTGGDTATVNTNAAFRGLLLNRDANFNLAAGGGALTLGDGGLRMTLPSANARTSTLSAEVVLSANQTWAVTNNGAGVATLTVAGNISDGGAGAKLTKAGNGVLTLAGNNSYGGLTTVRTGGVLRISHPAALGTTNGATSVENGGWLELSGGITVAEPITLAGDAALGYAGTMRSTSGSNVWSGPISFNGARVRVSAGSLDIVGGCFGAGGVFGTSGGTLLRISNLPILFGTGTLSAHLSGGIFCLNVAGNTWGTMDLSGGTVRTDVPNAFPAASVLQLQTGSTVDLNGNSQTVSQLKNANATAGARLVTSAAPATLTVIQSATNYYDGLLTGALSLVKGGNGMLTLSNALNAMSGSLTVQDGTLAIAPATCLGASTNITVSGGTLLLRSSLALTNAAHLSIADGGAKVSLAAGVAQAVDRLYLGGVRKGRGTWGATGSGATNVDDAHFTGSGVLSVLSGESTVWDAGGADVKFSTGANWDFDALPFFDGTALLTFATAGSSAALDIAANLRGLRLNRDADFSITAGGGLLTLGTGGLSAQASGTVSRAYVLAAPVTLAADQSWGVTNTGAGVTTLTLSGPVSDGASSFGLTKSGNGLLTLSGNNAYDGATAVGAGGGLRAAHNSALGGVAGGTDVASNGWVEVSGGVTVPEPLTLRDAGLSGALRSVAGTNVWSGPVSLAAPTRLRASAGSRLTLSGGVSGNHDLLLSPDAGGELAVTGGAVSLPSRKVSALGEGTVTLAGAGHAFATLEVAGAGMRLRLGATNALPATAVLSVGAAYSAMGVVDLNGFDQTVARLVRGTTSSSTNRIVTSAAPATLTVNETSASVIYFNGYLTGALGLTKGDSGYLALTGTNNTYTGATTVSAGTLEVGATARLGFSPLVTVSGGTLRLLNTNALADTATLRLSGSGKAYLQSETETVGALYLDGQRKGEGTWGSSGSPAQNVDDAHFSGAGVILVRPGTPGTVWDGGGSDALFDTPANWDTDWYPALDGSASVRFGTGGSSALLNTNIFLAGIGFSRDADFALAGSGGTLTLGSGGLWAQAPNATSRTYSVAAPVALAANQNWGVTNTGAGTTALVVSGAVSDGASSFGLAKSGNGLLTLSGDSSYDGPTSVAAGGGLRVSHANGLGSAAGGTDVASNGWVEIAGGVAVPEPLTLRDAGTNGALRSLSGTNVWSGPVALAAPTRLRAAAGSRLTLAGGVSGSSDLLLSPQAGGELAVSGAPLSLPSRKVCAYGEGTVTLGGGGHAYSTLEVSGAGLRLRLGASNVLPASSVLSVGATYSAHGVVDLNGFDQTVARLVRGTTGSSTNRLVTSATPATLTVNETSASAIYFNGYLTGALGLTKGDSGYLALTGTNNTYSGATAVGGGTLEVGATARLGFSPLVTVTGGTLRLLNANALADAATLRLSSSGKVYLQSGTDTVSALFLDGQWQRRGTYGSSASGATYKSDAYFSSGSAGVINVLTGPASVLSIR